jgi:hypothetical protein
LAGFRIRPIHHLFANQVFGSLEGKERRGEGMRGKENGYPFPCPDVLKIK